MTVADVLDFLKPRTIKAKKRGRDRLIIDLNHHQHKMLFASLIN